MEEWKNNSLIGIPIQMILAHLSRGEYSDLIRRTDTIVLSIIEVEFQFLHLDIFEHPDLLIRMRNTFVVQVGRRGECVTHTLTARISTWEGGSMNKDEPQSLQNLWADDLFPNLYSERLSEPWDMTVADRGWWT